MTEWLAHYEKDGELFFRIGRAGPDVVAEWLGIGRLVARRDGSTHRLERHPDADSREFAKIERGGVQLLLRHLAGKLALHGAAVESQGRAVVLLGRATQGKSTLAAALCTREDVALLADDAVALDRSGASYVVRALERLHWLDAAARRALGDLNNDVECPVSSGARVAGDVDLEGGYPAKAPIAAARVGAHGELVAFVDLVFTDGPTRLVRSSPLEAMAALVPQAVRFVLDDPDVQKRELEALGTLVDVVPVLRLERPRDLSFLSDSCERVRELLCSSPQR